MKVIVCHDSDAEALLAKMRLRERELVDRFALQTQEQRYVAVETCRAMLYVLTEWLQVQGFKFQ